MALLTDMANKYHNINALLKEKCRNSNRFGDDVVFDRCDFIDVYLFVFNNLDVDRPILRVFLRIKVNSEV